MTGGTVVLIALVIIVAHAAWPSNDYRRRTAAQKRAEQALRRKE